MPQGKWNAYENDIRVPFVIRGPNISRGSVREDILGTHVDLMPTLLGLAASNATIPSTMDGLDLSKELLSDVGSRSTVLIEYIGLGDVVRYGHLEDTYNNTFRALRIIDKTQPAGRRNIKYIEFTDCMNDWNFTEEPLEYELFDLDSDPFEMVNIFSSSKVPLDFIQQLQVVLRKLYSCSGQTCRDVRSLISSTKSLSNDAQFMSANY